MPGKIQLVLPGLFDLPLSELKPEMLVDGLPALNRILRFATPRPNPAFSIDAILRRVLAMETPPGQSASLPLAQSFAPSAQHQPRRLLLFQAVHLRPDLHSAIIVPIQNNQENLHDVNIIINDLRELFNVNCDITDIGAGLFLIALKEFDAPYHYPHILSVLGKAANPYVEQSRRSLGWYKLLNEMQMFLHQHQVNQNREQRGLLPANSLWFWGGGNRPDKFDQRIVWYCDDSVLNRFAANLDLRIARLDNLTKLVSTTEAAVIDLRLLEQLKTGAAKQLAPLLLDIENRLLQPLLRMIERDRTSLCLRAGFESDLELGAGAMLKFWRRPRNLASWTGQERAS